MAGKKAEKSKKKKTKKGGHIAAALIPTTPFTAVPRSPPPPPEAPEVDMGLSSGILGSSMLGRMFGTPDPMDGALTEETDTSLYDYENAKGTLPFQGTLGSRGRIPTPPHGFADEDTDYDDVLGEPLYDEARDSHDLGPDAMYAQPSRTNQRKSRSPSPLHPEMNDSLHDSTHGYDQQDSRASGGRSSMRSTGSHGRRSGRQTPVEITVEERIESQMIETSLKSAPPDSSLRRSRPGSRTPSQKSMSMSMTTTPKLETLRLQNAELQSKQSQLETQVQEQRELHRNMMAKLQEQGLLTSQNPDAASTQDMGSLLQETQSGNSYLKAKRESISSALSVESDQQVKEYAPYDTSQAGQLSQLSPQTDMPFDPLYQIRGAPSSGCGSFHSQHSQDFDTNDGRITRETMGDFPVLVEGRDIAQASAADVIGFVGKAPSGFTSSPMAKRKSVSIMNSPTYIDPQPTAESSALIETTGQSNKEKGITDMTMKKHEELMQSFQQRTHILEEENKELRDLNEQFQAEILSVRRMASYQDGDEVAGSQITILKKQLQDFRDESDTLKSTVHRLNGELGRYQAKYRPMGAEREDIPGLPLRGPRPSWLVNTKYLAPLLVAYDDRLREKDEAIKQYEGELQHFHSAIEEIIKENQRLHLRIEQTDVSGPLSMSEWKQLQEQCKLVLEENQLLMEQLDVQQNKAKDMHRAHVEEVSKMAKKLIHAEAERNSIEVEFETVRHRYSEVKRECDATVIENKTRVGMEDHLTAIADLKRALEEEKSSHHQEVNNLTNKYQTANAERKSMAVEMQDIKSQYKQLQTDLKALHKLHRKQQKKNHLLQSAVEMAQASDLTKEHYLTSVLKVAEKTVQERDSLSAAMEEKERQKKSALNKLMADKISVGKMEERLKMYKLKASEKIEKAVIRMKEQDHDFKGQQQEYEREIRHLRLLLKEREEMLENLTGEKRQVEDDLETMWQVASTDNRRMKETMKRSLRKLKDHSNISHMIDVEGDQDMLVTCDSDKEN